MDRREFIGEIAAPTPWEGEVDAGNAIVCGVEDCTETEGLRAFPWMGPEVGLTRWVCARCRAERWARLQDAAPRTVPVETSHFLGPVAIA